MNSKLWISAAVVATLALSSCEDPAVKMEQEMINQVVVKAMTDISVTTTATSTCTGQDTSWTNQFASCYVVNIRKLPEIEDARYSDYEFFAEINGNKVSGGEAVLDELNDASAGIVENAVFSQFAVNGLNLVIPIEDLYSAKFYVETPGNKREIRLNEVY